MRITPAYLPLIPTLCSASSLNVPVLALTATNPAPAGIRIVGVGFCQQGVNAPYTLISIGLDYPTGPSDLPDNVVLDRIYVFADPNPAHMFGDGIRLGTKSASLINSFLDGGHGKNETHWILSHNSIGPHTIRNNYFGGGMSAAIFYGGNGGPIFAAGKPIGSNILIEGNYFYKSLKWFPGNPMYVGDANFPCMKNMVEFKAGRDAVIRWNMGENSWGGCAGQQNAFTFTPRANLQCHGNQSCDLSGGSAALSEDKQTVTISNFSGLAIVPGQGLALPTHSNPALGGWEIHTVITADNDHHVYTVDAPYRQVYAPTGITYGQVFGPWNVVSNIEVTGNFVKNVEQGFLISGIDDISGLGAADNIVIRNNLFANLSPQMKISLPPISHNNVNLKFGIVEHGASNVEFDNNTWFTSPKADASVQQNNTILLLSADLGKVHGLGFKNNLVPYGDYGVYGNGFGTGAAGINATSDGPTSFLNNTLLGSVPGSSYEPCALPRSCAGNLFGSAPNFSRAFQNPDANIFSLSSDSPYVHAGFDGSDLGADTSQVAAILNFAATPATTSITFHWDLPNLLAKTGCSLEVSRDSSLVDDSSAGLALPKVQGPDVFRPSQPVASRSPSSLVNALRPDYFRRANFDRSNPAVTASPDGLHRSFQVGKDATSLGDDGVTHNLALTPGTTYYARLMCGGATERLSIATLPSSQ
jgi:hypothetical protein